MDSSSLVMIGGGVLGGIAFLVTMVVLGKRYNPMWMLTAAFMFLSPLSAAIALSPGILNALKWVRVGITLTTVFVGTVFFNGLKLRLTSLVFLIFVGLYVFSGLWSDLPIAAIKFKGLYASAVLAGFLTAWSIRGFDDLKRANRLLVLAAGAYAMLVLVWMSGNPSAFSRIGRLWAVGMSPNRLGQTCGPLLICCGYTALYDKSKPWKAIAYAVGTLQVLMLLYSGSRGGAGEGFIGCFILGLPLVRRPGLLAAVLVLCLIPMYFMLSQADSLQLEAAAERLTEEEGANREIPWARAMQEFRESPFMGSGWVYNLDKREGGSTANMHSIYMQTLAEMGILGMLVMVPTLIICGLRGVAMWVKLQPLKEARNDAHYALALVGAVLAHGVIESGTLMGGTPNAVLLGIGLGLFDRLIELADEWKASLAFDEAHAADEELLEGSQDGEGSIA